MQRLLFLICYELNGKKWLVYREIEIFNSCFRLYAYELNPYLFLHCQAAYLDELENYYIKHNEWISIVFGFLKRRLYKLDLPRITNYICGHLISCYPNRSYLEIQYNYISKLTILCNCKKKRGLPICSKKGEEIYDGKLVKFFEDEQLTNCSCSYV